MIPMIPGNRNPGGVLLALARLIFDESVVSGVVGQTIADMRQEMAAAGPNVARRLAARWRGYRAFWALVLVAPVAFWSWPPRGPRPLAFPDVAARVAASLIVTTILVFTWPAAGAWTLMPAVGGGLTALAIHGWQSRHPSRLALPDHVRRPEINLAAIPVGGDIGGLIFVVGSVAIVIAGVPMVRWFLVGVAIGGLSLALMLVRWHAPYASRPLPLNSIAAR